MKKLFILLLLTSPVYAGTVTIPTTYQPSGQVTNVNLNNNFNALAQVVNGNLDNSNADTTNGYRFFETKSALPAAGSQGRVIFLTTNNTLNIDNGTSWQAFTALPSSVVKGDIAYYDGSAWSRISAGTTKYPLISNGATQTPTYQQVDLTAGVTGILPASNLNAIGTVATGPQRTYSGLSGNGSYYSDDGEYFYLSIGKDSNGAVQVASGVASLGTAIPLPTGCTQANTTWIVSIARINQNTTAGNGFEVQIDSDRTVHARERGNNWVG